MSSELDDETLSSYFSQFQSDPCCNVPLESLINTYLQQDPLFIPPAESESLFSSSASQHFELSHSENLYSLSDTLWIPENDIYGNLFDFGASLNSSSGSLSSSSEKSGLVAKTRRRRGIYQKKVFPCPFEGCQIVYNRQSHLKVHIRKHTGEKPFQCTWPGCEWRFRRSDELSRHKRCHSGVKPYGCNICLKSFGRSDHLSKHLKIHERQDESSSGNELSCSQDVMHSKQWLSNDFVTSSPDTSSVSHDFIIN